MSTRTYDPGQHFMVLGSVTISGYADGTYISVERMSEAFTSVAGAGGEVARVRHRDRRASVKLTLMASSACNDLLTAIADNDERDGSGVGSLSIRDGNGTTVATAANAWIKKRPTVEFSKDLPNREWEIECEILDLFVGGNS
jgi:hypothetical protein